MTAHETVVITGASGGLGRAIAREFGRHGAHVALLARGQAGLEGAAEEVRSQGGKALVIPTDVANAEAVFAAAEEAEKQLGPIDAWVNNAMVTVFSPVKEMQPEDYRRTTEVTYLGVVHGTLAALKYMLPRDRGASFRWDRRWPTAVSPCSLPTAAPRVPSGALPIRSAANCFTTAARSA